MTATHLSIHRSAQAAAAALALIILGAAASPAGAQSVPQGSYLTSCTGAHMDGRTLKATCRGNTGQVRTELQEADNCHNDIAVNQNGYLLCKLGTQPPRGAGGGQTPQPYGQNPSPGSGGSGAPYGQQPQGSGSGGPGRGNERCDQLRARYQEIRDRLNYTNDFSERERLQRRLGEARGEYRASCGDLRD